MSKDYIVDKDTGKFMYYGETKNKQSLVDAGHTIIPSSNIRPSRFHDWDGVNWVEDTTEKTASENREKLSANNQKMADAIANLIDTLDGQGVLAVTKLDSNTQAAITERKTLKA